MKGGREGGRKKGRRESRKAGVGEEKSENMVA